MIVLVEVKRFLLLFDKNLIWWIDILININIYKLKNIYNLLKIYVFVRYYIFG